METIGWIGSILLACCAIPEAYVEWKYKDSPLSWTFLTMWGLGEVLITIPIIFKIQEPFLIVNYLLNILFISIIIYYKLKGEKMKYKFYKGQKFGNWEIVDPNREYIQEPSRIKPVILCYDSVYNELRYVRVQCLINRTSKGSKKGNIGWSTRCKFKSLPKYVYKYPLGKKKYRVLYKTPGTNSVKTLFYFNKLEDATNFAQVLH